MTDKVFFGAIADDFTGATDLAAMLSRSGAPVSLRLGDAGMADGSSATPFEVIALKCRTNLVSEAVTDARKALAWLKNKGAQRFFWKYCSTFDSTADGNIGPISEALMADLDVSQTIYCPAFPQNGRSIYMGYLYVGDQLLSESPMKDHPLTPMRDSNLMRLLAPQVEGKVGSIPFDIVNNGAKAVKQRLDELRVQGITHVVTDAIDDRHLTVLADAGQDMIFLTGGSALAAPLPDLYRAAGHINFDRNTSIPPETSAASLILSGSCSQMTRRQVSYFMERGPTLKLDPVALAENDHALFEAKRWLATQSLDQYKLIYASADPHKVAEVQSKLGRDKAGYVVEEALSALAAYALTLGIRRFVIAGGETSGAVTQKLGITKLDIGSEITPGVPWTFTKIGVNRIALALKSGNFGKETFFFDALEKLNA